jgi:glutathione S-transferase
MLTLFYAPGACSIAPHIALREVAAQFTLCKVDFLRGKRLGDGREFASVNPKGYVPALLLENGELLTETAVMVQYIADLKPGSGLAPTCGTFDRVRLQEWLNFIATELHKGMAPLHKPSVPDDYKKVVREVITNRLRILEEALQQKPFLMGPKFTVADAYAFFCLRAWAQVFKNDLQGVLADYFGSITARPAVKAALDAEGFSAR